MTTKNPYRKKGKLEIAKTRQLVRCFCEDMSATMASRFLHLERNTVNAWYNYFRKVIYQKSVETDVEVRE